MEFPNGDRCVFMSINFIARIDAETAATAHVGDEESTDVAWFSPDELPGGLRRSAVSRIEAARAWLADPSTTAPPRRPGTPEATEDPRHSAESRGVLAAEKINLRPHLHAS